MLRLATAVDEELGLPDGDHAVDLADEHVQAPVAGVGLNALDGPELQPYELRDQPLELLAGAVLAPSPTSWWKLITPTA